MSKAEVKKTSKAATAKKTQKAEAKVTKMAIIKSTPTLFSNRQKTYTTIEKDRNTKIISYVTGDRKGMETIISSDIIDIFVEHLDAIGPTPKISLILYTKGGDTSTAWRLINLLHIFCEELEVIIISKALSAGTLISLGANKIIMTKQAALGPIDPSINHPLNPSVPGHQAHSKAPVSVEAIRGYLDEIQNQLGIKEPEQLSQIIMHLADKVHPLVLGQIFRTHSQIRSLAEKLLPRQVNDEKKIKTIIDFLCAESGSHDYTINRREAVKLGLNIENPSEKFYKLLKSLHTSYTEELSLLDPYDPAVILGAEQIKPYSINRAIIESVKVGSHVFVSEGNLRKEVISQPPVVIEQVRDDRMFEGWKKL